MWIYTFSSVLKSNTFFVAADVVWLDELVPLLVKALVALASPVTTVLVAHQVYICLQSSLYDVKLRQSRSLKTESLFFSLLEERFYIDRVCVCYGFEHDFNYTPLHIVLFLMTGTTQ